MGNLVNKQLQSLDKQQEEQIQLQWILNEFDFKENNQDLIEGVDILPTNDKKFKFKKLRRNSIIDSVKKSFLSYNSSSQSHKQNFLVDSDSNSNYADLVVENFSDQDNEQFKIISNIRQNIQKEFYVKIVTFFLLFVLIFVSEYLLNSSFKQLNDIILKILFQGKEFENLCIIYQIFAGNEITGLFLFLVIFNGKYHRAYIVSILIAIQFFISNILQIIYQDLRPLANDNFQGFGNPSGEIMSAAIFTTYLSLEFNQKGIIIGITWLVYSCYCLLILKLNSLNQIIFGTIIGIWTTFFCKQVLDFKLRITRHFQKIVRGRYMNDKLDIATKYQFFIMFSSIILVIIANIILLIIIQQNSDLKRKLSMFLTEQEKCDIFQFFIYNKVKYIGYLIGYLGVYMGSLYRYQFHGMQRIEYSQFIEYDKKKCKYYMHVTKLWFLRFLILNIFFVQPFIVAPQLLCIFVFGELNIFYESLVFSILPVGVFTFLTFAYFEKFCQCMKIDINHFEFISQKEDVNQIMQNMMCKELGHEDINDLDTSHEYEGLFNVEFMLEQQMQVQGQQQKSGTSVKLAYHHPHEVSFTSLNHETPDWNNINNSERQLLRQNEQKSSKNKINQSDEKAIYDNERIQTSVQIKKFQSSLSQSSSQSNLRSLKNPFLESGEEQRDSYVDEQGQIYNNLQDEEKNIHSSQANDHKKYKNFDQYKKIFTDKSDTDGFKRQSSYIYNKQVQKKDKKKVAVFNEFELQKVNLNIDYQKFKEILQKKRDVQSFVEF